MTITIFFVIGVISLATVAALATPVAARLRLPLPVLLATVGFVYGLVVTVFGLEPQGIALDSYDAWFVEQLALNSSTLLTVLLPPLLFEMALHVDVRRLIEDAAAVFVMAIVAVVAATIAVGTAVWWASDIGLVACLILGAAVATTDPSAVISTFRDIGAPRRLLVILEGESLLNDAAAIALFALLAGVLAGTDDVALGGVVLSFCYSFGAGMVTGLALAFVAGRVYPLLASSSVAEVSITLALAYTAYLVSELAVGGSGVVAVVFAALATGSGAFVNMGPGNWERVQTVWDQIGFWANAVILPLSASLVPGLLVDLDLGTVGLLLVVYLFALIARAAMLFGFLPLLDLVRITSPLGARQKLLVAWGGVRGGVTLVLALSMAELSVLGDDARPLAALAAGFTLMTLLINASTLRLVTRLLGLSGLSAQDSALRERIVVGSIERIRTHIAEMAQARDLEPAAIAAVDAHLVEREDEVRERAAREGARDASFADNLWAGLSIICGREMRLILRAFEDGAIGPRATTALRLAAERVSDATRVGGRAAYDLAITASIKPDRRYRRAVVLSFYLSWDRPLRQEIELHLTRLLETDRIVRELREFADTALGGMISAEAAANISALLKRRGGEVDAEIAAMAAQYPDYALALERLLIARAALRRERLQLRQLFADGVIGPELNRELAREIDAREQGLKAPPALDLVLTPEDLLNGVPLFAALDAKQRRRLSRRLRTRFAVPDETILTAGQRGREMYFIASGVCHVVRAPEPVVLCAGDFFGEIALLRAYQRRKTTVVSRGYCRLLVLSRRDFARLVKRDPSIERVLREAADRQVGQDPAQEAWETSKAGAS